MQLAAVVHGPSPSMTDSEWLSFLEKSSNLDVDYFRKAADSYQASLEPIREAMASKQVRQAMQKKMKYVHKKAQTGEAPLLSGDRVIAKNSQYTTKTGCGKFETKDGHVREYTVLSVSQGFVQLQEQGTHDTTFKHEANLKLMPRACFVYDGMEAKKIDSHLHLGKSLNQVIPQKGGFNDFVYLFFPYPYLGWPC